MAQVLAYIDDVIYTDASGPRCISIVATEEVSFTAKFRVQYQRPQIIYRGASNYYCRK